MWKLNTLCKHLDTVVSTYKLQFDNYPKAGFKRIDITPSAVHGATSLSQITMDVYGCFQTHRPTPSTAAVVAMAPIW